MKVVRTNGLGPTGAKKGRKHVRFKVHSCARSLASLWGMVSVLRGLVYTGRNGPEIEARGWAKSFGTSNQHSDASFAKECLVITVLIGRLIGQTGEQTAYARSLKRTVYVLHQRLTATIFRRTNLCVCRIF